MNTRFLEFYRLSGRVRGRLFTLLVRGAFHSFGRRTTLQPPFRIAGERRISIGSHVFVGPGSWFQVMAPETKPGIPAIRIGNRVSISGFCTITAIDSVTIEDAVLMARYVYISDHSHSVRDQNRPILEQGITEAGPVLIRSGAWLGQSVVVCPGVTIGRNAVVGANSVVRHDVPDCCIAAGAPARIIRRTDGSKYE